MDRHPAELIQSKLEVFDWLMSKNDKRVQKSPAGFLFKSIEADYTVPKGFVSKAEQEKREAIRQANQREKDAEDRRKQQEAAREREERQAVHAYWQALTPSEQAALDQEANAQADLPTLDVEHGPLKELGQRIRRETYIRQLLLDQGKLLIPTD